ncbi:hypothetical protein BGZ60DRAFT_182025 [Tricladium varicosporioides]|nr:hypothetical protein BGZ60DRAFT_182025 [Hymenoscyphus varicosporioides]
MLETSHQTLWSYYGPCRPIPDPWPYFHDSLLFSQGDFSSLVEHDIEFGLLLLHECVIDVWTTTKLHINKDKC